MTADQVGQMQWRREPNGDLELYVRGPACPGWVHYRRSNYSVPDREWFSRGYATYQALYKRGWQLLPVPHTPES
jgi:hypothetical protein